jgi:KilA-N domain
MSKQKINVKGSEITILQKEKLDYISLTDMVKSFEGGSALIEQWLKNKDTVLFLGIWEKLNNPLFNSLEFEGIKNEAGRNSFYLSAKKWIEKTKAIGLISSAGRYGATFANKDIAFEFGSWLSPEFKLYLIKEYQHLKELEQGNNKLTWNIHRTLSKINYRIHTDAIKEHIIPSLLTQKDANTIYATEVDVLNMAMFGKTAKQWRTQNSTADGNIRDHATLEQLLVLANLESLNAEFVKMALPQPDRLQKLNATAITQLKAILQNPITQKLK